MNLTLSSNDPSSGSGVAEMRFSNDGTTWSEWEPFANSKEWVVSEGDGEKTIYVQTKDRAGNQSGRAQDTIVLDQTAPVVSSTSPLNNQTGVLVTDNISATFAENGSGIDPDSLITNASPFKVVQVRPTGNVPVSGEVSYNENDQEATFDPVSSLAKGLYRVTLTGVADNADNVMPDYTWTFATAGPSSRR